MKTYLTYQVVVASPNDCSEERLAARDAILDWNSGNRNQNIRLDPLLWEFDATPDVRDLRAQEVINRQLIDDCDIVVAILGGTVGSRTGGYEGGTIEEIHRAMTLGKRVLLYLRRSREPGAPDGTEKRRLERVLKKLRKYGLSSEYDDVAELRPRFARDLAATVNELSPYPEAIACYLGRFPSFNSWDDIRQQSIRASRESHLFLVKSILDTLGPGDVVQATDSLHVSSKLGGYWLGEGLEYLGLNFESVRRKIEYIRYFVVSRDDLSDRRKASFIRRICGLHEMAGVDARLVQYEDLRGSCLYEFAVFGEKFLDLAVFDFRSERVLENTISWASHRVASFKEKIRLLEANVVGREFGKRRVKAFARVREEAKSVSMEFKDLV